MYRSVCKRWLCMLLACLLLSGAFAVSADALENAYQKNVRWHLLTKNQAAQKYSKGDTFVLYGFYDDSPVCEQIGNDTLSAWMDVYGKDVYGINVRNGLPDWAWGALNELGTTLHYLPYVLFVRGGRVVTAVDYTQSVAHVQEQINDAFYAFYGVTPQAASISVRTMPDKTLYKVGDAFDPAGLTLDAVLLNGKTAVLSSGFQCTGFSSQTPGVQTVTVQYGGVTTTFDVKVSAVYTVPMTVFYFQTEARTMFTRMNALRTGSDAWYWNENNTQKVYVHLPALVYDYDLERIAMQRAAELVTRFSHYRPNDDLFNTLFGDAPGYCGENIAYGRQTTAASVQTGLEEANAKYSGQAHRRNMLSEHFNAVGCACVEYGGVRFWVQEFRTNIRDKTATEPIDEEQTVPVDILDEFVASRTHSLDRTSYSLQSGESEPLPVLTSSIRMAVDPKYTITASESLPWESADPSVASVVDGNVVAGDAGGDTTLTATYDGQQWSVPVSVIRPPLAGAVVTLESYNCQYTGSPCTPQVLSVQLEDGRTLRADDYTVTYENNDKPGMAAVIVTGQGQFFGTVRVSFTIYCDHQPVMVPAQPATCTETGYTAGRVCTICGAVLLERRQTPATGHNWDAGAETTAPTCTEAGVRTFTCQNDRSHTYTEAIPAIGHSWDAGAETTAPTCTEAGVRTFTCQNDRSHTYTEAIPAVGHSWDAGTETTAPTCTEAGVRTFTCQNDRSHTRTEAIPAKGHSFGEWVETKAPTEDEYGEKQRTCSACSFVETQRIDKLPRRQIKLNQTSLTLFYKDTATLTADAAVTWKSSNEKVAKVDPKTGVVTATGKGTATITAVPEQGGDPAACQVTVKYSFVQILIRIFLLGFLWY